MNNPTDPISRASVLEALNGMILPRSGGFTFSLIDQHNQTIRDVIGRLGELPVVKDSLTTETSLEKELESLLDELPEDVEIRTCEVELGKKGYYAGNSSKYVFGNTRSEALLKFKEALNSNR